MANLKKNALKQKEGETLPRLSQRRITHPLLLLTFLDFAFQACTIASKTPIPSSCFERVRFFSIFNKIKELQSLIIARILTSKDFLATMSVEPPLVPVSRRFQ